MVPPVTTPKQIKQSWAQINKIRKEEKKKWKESNLKSKLLKKNEPAPTTDDDETKITAVPVTQGISTISLGIPGSIIENAQSPELRTYLAGQIARAACIFQVDEIVVYDDYGDEANARTSQLEDDFGIRTARSCCVQLARILQYLECPQYLRKSFFPLHKDLKFSGLLNPLNAPHHLSQTEDFLFREGVVTNKPVKPGRGSIVNVGLLKEVYVDKLLTPGIRCTVRLHPQEEGAKKLKGTIVSPNTPRTETGVYWGYNVRLANSLAQVFAQCSYKDGYDVTIGTSDTGTSIDDFECTPFNHLLVMFGGVEGLEAVLENDDIIKESDPWLLFDHYLNALPNQGSKTIRTEEAILVTLAALRPKMKPLQQPKIFEDSNITSAVKQ